MADKPIRKPDGTKIRNFAIDIYDVILKESEVRSLDEMDLESPKAVIWEGSVSRVIRDLGINQSYHTQCIRLLTHTECIEQIKRGSRNIPSRYLILKDPHEIKPDDWPSVNSIVKSRREGLTIPPGGYKLLAQRIEGLEKRLEGLDIKRALIDLQQQNTDLLLRLESLTNGETETTS